MGFNWINIINMAAVVWLILINVIVARKGLSDSFSSKHLIINREIRMYGAYDSPYFYKWLEIWFRFCRRNANLDMFYDISTGDLQFSLDKKANGGMFVLYGLAFVPAILFLLNGLLLRHPALVVASLVFGFFHFLIVKENI